MNAEHTTHPMQRCTHVQLKNANLCQLRYFFVLYVLIKEKKQNILNESKEKKNAATTLTFSEHINAIFQFVWIVEIVICIH